MAPALCPQAPPTLQRAPADVEVPVPQWVRQAGWGEPFLTPQVVSQGGEGEASEGAVLSLGAIEVGQADGHPDGPRGEEADEDGAQDARNDEEDEEGGLGIDGGTHEAHEEAEGQQHGAVEQLVPVALGQDVDTCACFLPWAETSQDQRGSEGASPGTERHRHCARHDGHQLTGHGVGQAVLVMLGMVPGTSGRALGLLG